MIWFVARQIFILMYYFYKPQKPPPLAPTSLSSMTCVDEKLPEWMLQLMASFGGKLSEWIPHLKKYCTEKLSKWIPQLMAQLNEKLLEWIPLLAHHPFFYYDCWIMRCPKYFIDCCPLVKRMNVDTNILYRLNDVNPLRAFSYLLLRRIAEFIAQSVASWLIIIWTIMFIIFTWYSISFIKQKSGKKTNTMQKSSSSIWNSKCMCLFLSLLPLSFIILYSNHSVLIPSHLLHVTGDEKRFFPTFWDLMPRKKKRHSYALFNLLDLLRFSSLYTDLYIEELPIEFCETAPQKLCHTTKIFLSWWSVLIFLTLMYSVAALALYIFILLPMKKIFSRLFSDDSKSRSLLTSKKDTTSKKEREKTTMSKSESEAKYFMSGKGDTMYPKEKEETINRKLESGDAPEIQKRNLKYHPPKSAFKPRYVTRGVKACLH